MKFLIIFTCGLLLNSVQFGWGIDPEQAREMMIQMSEDCREKEGASKEDVEHIADKKPLETKNQKCLAGCLQEQFSIIEDGKFSPEGFLRIAKMAAEEDEEKVKNAEILSEDCKDMAHADKCELSVMIMDCIKQNAEKRGMKYDE